MVADFPLAYDERTYSERCVMDCTPKIDGGEADFPEQSAERRSKREVLCLGGAKPPSRNGFPKRSEENLPPVALEPSAYDERTSDRRLREARNGRRNIAVSEAKRGKPTSDNKIFLSYHTILMFTTQNYHLPSSLLQYIGLRQSATKYAIH